jgi:hypothetical protein
MLSRILGNHHAIFAVNELHYFGDLCDPATAAASLDCRRLEQLTAGLLAREARGIWGAGPTDADRARARQFCATLPQAQRSGFGVFTAVLGNLARAAGKLIVCEQTPRNVFYAQRLLDGMPNACIVHIVRDPRAVFASQKNRWQLRRLGAKNVPVAELVRNWLNYHPLTMAKLWVNATRAALELADHPRMRIVRFEDLITQPAAAVAGICEFLGVDFEPEMLGVPQWGSSNVQHVVTKRISTEVDDQWQAVLTAGEMKIAERSARLFTNHFNFSALTPGSLGARLSWGRYLLSYPLHLLGVALANPRRARIQLSAMLSRKE